MKTTNFMAVLFHYISKNFIVCYTCIFVTLSYFGIKTYKYRDKLHSKISGDHKLYMDATSISCGLDYHCK
ncbi:rCG20921 [Rattus norvegicus]|uniref:RCG20921 n=1 Tax=Rattus norvegicus TaxID=10116 RepID=A6JEC5_RAT|nr:rCG20921 [Rattus norvegicus]